MKKALALCLSLIMLFSTSISASAMNGERIELDEPSRVRALIELRERNSDTYLLSDGSYECVVYSEDKYFKNADGSYVEIDNSIIAARHTRSGESYGYKNAENDFSVYFSENEPSVLINSQMGELSFAFMGAEASKALLKGKPSLRSVNGFSLYGDNFISYPNVCESTDIVYSVESGGLKEYIVLNAAGAPRSFSFAFSAKGYSFVETEAGTIGVYNGEGELAFEHGSLFAVDSAGAYTEALEYTQRRLYGNRAEITVSISDEYVNDPDRVFPIMIDPSVMVTGASKTYDSFVSSANPTTNYKMDTTLRTGKDVPYGVRRAYIKFDLPTTIPAGSITNSYINIKYKSGSAPNSKAYRVTGDWSSGTINWNNKPGFSSIDYSSTHVYSNNWYRLHVTDIVKAWRQGTYQNYGFVLKDMLESDTSKWTTYYSSDAPSPNKPELHIVYTDPIESNCVYMIKNVSKGTYLTATTSSVILENKDSMDGRQLWYLVADGNGYKLYAMGNKDIATRGRLESLLRGSAPNTQPTFTNQNGSYISWSIAKNGSYYQLSNSWLNYGNTTLTAAYANNNVSMIASSSGSGYARWSFEKVETTTFNNYWVGSYYINGRRIKKGERVHIKIELIESGTESVYLNSIIQRSYFDIVKQWNGLSDNVVIYGPDDPVPYGINAFHIVYKGHTNPISLYGKTTGIGADGNIDASHDSDWYGAKIELNLNKDRGLYGESREFIEYVILHELGHALKLAHPRHAMYIDTTVINGRGAYADDNKVCSIMNIANPFADGNLSCVRAKWHDIISLRNKWG